MPTEYLLYFLVELSGSLKTLEAEILNLFLFYFSCISGTYEVGLYEKLRADYNGIIFLLAESGSLQEIGDYRLRRYVENVKKLKKEAENLNKYQAKEGMR